MRYAASASILIATACVALAGRTITGAGATFPYPVYAKWFQQFKDKTGVQINYQSIGSGAGVKQLAAGTIDFGASDKPMSDKQFAQFKTRPLHFPTVIGAVVPIYNIDGVAADLNFTGPVLAGIFLGSIRQWNDPAIASLNPSVKLPNQSIVVVVRSDGSGTTYVFTDFLAKTSPEWKRRMTVNTAVNWPVGLRQRGNEGVAGFVKLAPNSIGYVELTFAASQKMRYGLVRNSANRFVKADITSLSAAAESAATSMPDDFRVSITDAAGELSYPIATFTWLLIPDRIEDAGTRHAITAFLNWMLTDGQPAAAPLHYAPLPKAVIVRELRAISSIH